MTLESSNHETISGPVANQIESTIQVLKGKKKKNELIFLGWIEMGTQVRSDIATRNMNGATRMIQASFLVMDVAFRTVVDLSEKHFRRKTSD